MMDLDFLIPVMGERLRGKVAERTPSFDAFYPRRYVEPATHYSPRVVAMLGAMSCDIASTIGPDARQELWEMVCMGRLARARVPTWWVGADLFTALTQTTPPRHVRFEDLLWPVPAIQFIMPIAESRAIFKRNVPFLCGSMGPAREVVKLPKNKYGREHELCLAPAQSATLGSVVLMGPGYFTEDGQCDGTLSVHAPVTAGLTVGQVMTGEWPHGFDIGNGANYVEGDKERLDLMISVFIQLLMLLSMRGEVMQTGGDLLIGAQTMGKGADKVVIKPSLFAPKWVGEHYKRQRGEPKGGTHASPEMHLRSGHWRDQPIGKGRALTKNIWIKPMWINAPKEDEP